MDAHRGITTEPVKRETPMHIATTPNQVWTWDITWLNASVKGHYYKLYLMLDMFSRLIVAYEVWEAVLSQGIAGEPLVLHSDNGSPMKAATFLATLEKLGVQSSFSRPRVSNDNPYSESLFKTMKYRPKYPFNKFSSLEEARGRHPERWSGKIRDWSLPEYVALNPVKEEELKCPKLRKQGQRK